MDNLHVRSRLRFQGEEKAGLNLYILELKRIEFNYKLMIIGFEC